MVTLDSIFDVWYGVNMEVVNSVVVHEGGVPFVSRQSTNNGIACYVKPVDGVSPNPAHTLSIAVSGTVLSTYYHDYEYYSGRDIYIAKPKIPLTKEEMLYYAFVIESNRYKYNYGRGANKTFRKLMIPAYEELPAYVRKYSANYQFEKSPLMNTTFELDVDSWHWFKYDEVFDIRHGFYNKKPDNNPLGDIPFVGATDSNNGVTSHSDLDTIENTTKTGEGKNSPIAEKLFKGNCITVSNDGSVGFAFYQGVDFTCSHSVNPLYIKKEYGIEMNKYIAMFLCTLIEKERFRWAYGRKWRPKRMPSSLIKLPAIQNADGTYTPDWQFMEDYIKSLPYSKNI